MENANLYAYTIVFSKNAEKFLDTLDKQTKLRILEKIKALKTNNANLDIKKLKSRYTLYRLRVGNFRVVYTVKHDRIIIYIIAIGHRRDIYQHSNFT